MQVLLRTTLTMGGSWGGYCARTKLLNSDKPKLESTTIIQHADGKASFTRLTSEIIRHFSIIFSFTRSLNLPYSSSSGFSGSKNADSSTRAARYGFRYTGELWLVDEINGTCDIDTWLALTYSSKFPMVNLNYVLHLLLHKFRSCSIPVRTRSSGRDRWGRSATALASPRTPSTKCCRRGDGAERRATEQPRRRIWRI